MPPVGRTNKTLYPSTHGTPRHVQLTDRQRNAIAHAGAVAKLNDNISHNDHDGRPNHSQVTTNGFG